MPQRSANDMERKLILGALGSCTSRKDVESVFEAAKIENEDNKTKLLLETMGNPELFFSVGEPTMEQKYELVIESFLSMSWKFAQMCKRGALNEK